MNRAARLILVAMSALFAVAFAAVIIAPAQTKPPRFVRANELYVLAPGNPPSAGDYFISTAPFWGCSADLWCKVQLPADVAPDATAVFMSGIVIITHGYAIETADIKFGCRAPGDPQQPSWYNVQAVEASVGNGQRSTFGTWIPARNHQIECLWTRSTPGIWPDNSSYAINGTIQAYTR